MVDRLVQITFAGIGGLVLLVALARFQSGSLGLHSPEIGVYAALFYGVPVILAGAWAVMRGRPNYVRRAALCLKAAIGYLVGFLLVALGGTVLDALGM